MYISRPFIYYLCLTALSRSSVLNIQCTKAVWKFFYTMACRNMNYAHVGVRRVFPIYLLFEYVHRCLMSFELFVLEEDLPTQL